MKTTFICLPIICEVGCVSDTRCLMQRKQSECWLILSLSISECKSKRIISQTRIPDGSMGCIRRSYDPQRNENLRRRSKNQRKMPTKLILAAVAHRLMTQCWLLMMNRRRKKSVKLMRKFVEWNVHERKQPSTENCSLYSLSNVIWPVRGLALHDGENHAIFERE